MIHPKRLLFSTCYCCCTLIAYSLQMVSAHTEGKGGKQVTKKANEQREKGQKVYNKVSV